jgi:hypothetical protein
VKGTVPGTEQHSVAVVDAVPVLAHRHEMTTFPSRHSQKVVELESCGRF